MFKITSGKGFHVTFANGYTVSVQWGNVNYSSNRGRAVDALLGNWEKVDRECGEAGSVTVETAVWAADGELIAMQRTPGGWQRWVASDADEYCDTVQGWQSPADVLALMNWAAAQPAEAES